MPCCPWKRKDRCDRNWGWRERVTWYLGHKSSWHWAQSELGIWARRKAKYPRQELAYQIGWGSWSRGVWLWSAWSQAEAGHLIDFLAQMCSSLWFHICGALLIQLRVLGRQQKATWIKRSPYSIKNDIVEASLHLIQSRRFPCYTYFLLSLV